MSTHAVVNLAWNSNGWAGAPTPEDVERATFAYVREHGEMHEDVNLDADRFVRGDTKYGYAYVRGNAPGFSHGEGVVFFASRDPATGLVWVVGAYGRATFGEFTHPEGGARVFNLSCPREHVVAFPADARVQLDYGRHLEGARRISQTGIKYIRAPAARTILDDLVAAHDAGGHGTAKVEALVALVGEDGERDPGWVLGPWPEVNEAYQLGFLGHIHRCGLAAVWWSWSLLPGDAGTRARLLARGFRVGLAAGGRVAFFYDVAPGGVVDQLTEGRAGEQVPCPWPCAADDGGALPSGDVKRSDRRLLWFRVVRVGRVDPPVPVSAFRVPDGGAVGMGPTGFRYGLPPRALTARPLDHDPGLDVRVAAVLRDRKPDIAASGVRAAVAVLARCAAGLDQGVGAAVPAEARGALLTPRIGCAAWETAVEAFVHAGGDVDTAGTLLAAWQPERFVAWPLAAGWERLARELGLGTPLAGPAKRLVWAAGVARQIVATPSARAALGPESMWTLAALVRAEEGPVPDGERDPRVDALRRMLHRKGQIVLLGPPGTGKTWLARQIVEDGRVASRRPADRRAFVLVANPEGASDWHWDELHADGEVAFDATKQHRRHFHAAREGDLVFGWLGGRAGRCVYTVAEVAEPVDPEAEAPTLTLRVLDDLGPLTQPIALSTLKAHPVLAQAVPIRSGLRGTCFALERAEALALVALIGAADPAVAKVLASRLWTAEPASTFDAVTFHPSTTYEDFVEGIRPVLSDAHDGQVRYECRDGLFTALCLRADEHRERPFYLLIDELNRGNLPAILGELITLLERDKRDWIREGADSQRYPRGRNPMAVRLPYSGRRFSVPPNLFVIGTMNTADRSIALLDSALRRRFRFVEVQPDPDLLRSPTALVGQQAPAAAVLGLCDRLASILAALNARIAAARGRDWCVGHSYLLPLREQPDIQAFSAALKEVWDGELRPLLAEYFFDDGERLEALVGPELLELADDDARALMRFPDRSGTEILDALAAHLLNG